MNRREAIQSAAAGLVGIAGFGLAQTAPAAQTARPIDGVGVFFYPPGATFDENGQAIDNRAIAAAIAGKIQQGSVLTLPSVRDDYGNLAWDFRIESGGRGQVKVDRSDE